MQWPVLINSITTWWLLRRSGTTGVLDGSSAGTESTAPAGAGRKRSGFGFRPGIPGGNNILAYVFVDALGVGGMGTTAKRQMGC